MKIEEDLAVDLSSNNDMLKQRVQPLGVVMSSHPILDTEFRPNSLDVYMCNANLVLLQ